MSRPYTVAITGGIASGKSTVGALFAQLGAAVIDADQVARDVVALGSPGLAQVAAHFGDAVLDTAGGLDRAGMRKRIFNDASARADLEAIVHPLIRAELLRQRDASQAAYVMLMLPIFKRMALQAEVDRILVVDAPTETQRQRLVARDGNSAELAGQIIAAQESRAERLALADDVIENHATEQALSAQIQRLHQHYSSQARR